MKAAVYHRYGPPNVVKLKTVKTPKPKRNEVRVKVHATTVSSADWRLRSLDVPAGFSILMRLFMGISGPRKNILGTELSGTIDAIGPDVSQFAVGDQVIAHPGLSLGAHAEYCVIPEDGHLALKPDTMSFEQAAALSFGGLTALSFLRDQGKIKAGESIVIVGASGAVGSAAVQLAKYFGAQVTAVTSTDNVALVANLGADHVIDYTEADFTQNGQSYDIIMDCVGSSPYSHCKKSLKPQGRLLLVVAGMSETISASWTSLFSNKTLIAGSFEATLEDVLYLRGLFQSGDYIPLIDRVYPFEQIIDAHTYVDTGRKKGSVVIKMA